MSESELRRRGWQFGCLLPLLVCLLFLHSWYYTTFSSVDLGLLWVPAFFGGWAVSLVGSLWWLTAAFRRWRAWSKKPVFLLCLNLLPALTAVGWVVFFWNGG